MRIAAVASALPERYYDQSTLTRELEEIWKDDLPVLRRLGELHDHVEVEGRHLALPLERYRQLTTFGDFNAAWIEAATDLGAKAVTEALRRAGLRPKDVDAIFFSTVTGVASPSIDARLVNRLGLRTDVKRVPLFGLGCVAGASALSRAADYVKGYPEHVAVVLTVELCSLTLQRGDRSVANLIATGLFGDGAGAAVVVGAARKEGRGPRILATKSVFYPETEEVMGWRISEEGFRIVLSPEVPVVARERLPADVDAFLAEHDLTRQAIDTWICHPGGPKVLRAMAEGLGLGGEAFELSWECLRRVGNLSSASVLLVLEATLERRPDWAPGSRALLLAMGPGFCSELLLLGD
jgi:alkylresorcinol/alkylpyrone synthase